MATIYVKKKMRLQRTIESICRGLHAAAFEVSQSNSEAGFKEKKNETDSSGRGLTIVVQRQHARFQRSSESKHLLMVTCMTIR